MSRHNSSQPSTGRLIIDAPASGAWNMAVDETLVATAAEQGVCSLRFYEWSEPTLSLGYFQRYDQRLGHAGSRDCPVVRRSSGGGAIVHDRELTYSLAAPVAHPLAADGQRLYTLVHEALISTLAHWRIAAKRFGAAMPSDAAGPAVSDAHFLCFARRTAEDLVLDAPPEAIEKPRDIRQSNATGRSAGGNFSDLSQRTVKICGSAQRRRQGAIVQHGSLLLARSSSAPELPGILEITGVPLSITELIRIWKNQLENALSFGFSEQGLAAREHATIRELAIEKYSSHAWTRRR